MDKELKQLYESNKAIAILFNNQISEFNNVFYSFIKQINEINKNLESFIKFKNRTPPLL